MAAVGTWTPLTLLAVILGYWIVAVALLLTPVVAPVVREAWQARRARQPGFVLFRPYPAYLRRFRSTILSCLLAPPVLLAAAWFWARML